LEHGGKLFVEHLHEHRKIVADLTGKQVRELPTIRNYTPSAVFKFYLDAYSQGLDLANLHIFDELLQIGMAQPEILGLRPVEWAQTQVQILLEGKLAPKDWIKDACDLQPHTPDDWDEMINWRTWRAPRFVHMNPSANTPYDARTALMREDNATTGQVLNGLASRFVNFVEIHLERVAGQAHIKLAKERPQNQHCEQQNGYPSAAGLEVKTTERSTGFDVLNKGTAFQHSDDYCRIKYQGQDYYLTESAGKIVSVLHEAYQDGKVGIGASAIKKRAKCRNLWDQFKRRDGRKFWKVLIRRTGKDFFSLNLAPLTEPQQPLC